MSGTVHLVGAGPGDPDLVTVRARHLIETCDALVFDYLVADGLLQWVRPECQTHCVGKRPGFHSVPQAEIERLLVRLAGEGKTVVRLKGGDPFVFGRGGEEMQCLRRHGIPYTIVPAVTAAIAGAARAELPLSHRNFNAAVVFLTGHRDPAKDESPVDWAAWANLEATLCLYMAMGRLREITAALIAAGMDPARPAAVVQWATTPNERRIGGTVATIADRAVEAGLGAPAVVYIGSTVGLADLAEGS